MWVQFWVMIRRYLSRFVFSGSLLLVLWLAGCAAAVTPEVPPVTLALLANLPTPPITPAAEQPLPLPPTATAVPTPTIYASPFPTYEGVPTPDPPRSLAPGTGGEVGSHQVSFGENLGYIATQYGTTVEELMRLNDLSEADLLFVGQVLQVPGPPAVIGPDVKLIPDSELVYGPAARHFGMMAALVPYDGFLVQYSEDVEGEIMTGPAIVQLVAERFQVNPRLLLAALEYRSGWVTQRTVTQPQTPMGYGKAGYEGLYRQLGWAANLLNWGFYGVLEGGLTSFTLADETRVGFAPGLNAGTVGLQLMLGSGDTATYESWLYDIGPNGLYSTYLRLFGNPFAYTVDPLWVSSLAQPAFELPWAAGETWYFTGGPHGGWASGSAWAALDFVPNNEQLGCYPSDAWVRAVADGVVARAGKGAVVIDLDGDGYVGTGWAVHYMHMESRDRIQAGAMVRAGDLLGHPSCEGGYSNGTHVHIARTYNGRWVSADGPIPFEMGGWISQGLGREYDGLLVRGDVVREACECREESNAITAEP